MIRKLTIAIDGPAGAGKSTIAQHVAQALGYVNLESGAMYRALALKALDQSTALDDETALAALAENSQIVLQPLPTGNRVLLDGRDVSQRIRGPDVTAAASRVSVHPEVRRRMVARQRELGREGGVVMEGRDIGTKVFPHAEVKIFLEASPAVRAARRIQQEGGDAADPRALEAMAAEITRRDQRDRHRLASPLVASPDALVIDSSSAGIEEVVNRILAEIRTRLAAT